MNIIYFDVFSGISGDMCLGALIDAGCSIDALKAHLAKMEIPGFDLQCERVGRGPLTGTKAHVHVTEEHHVHRHLKDVLAIVDRTTWPGSVREQIEAAFTALARAEGEVHGKPYDKIHFHEVGSYDAIIDISGTLLGLHWLGIEHCACSKIHVGEGFAHAAHGKIPVPVPATANLLRGFDMYSTGREMEMVTPTGAALIHALCGGSTSMPELRLRAIGYGAGGRDPKDLPNMLRVFLGEPVASSTDRVVLIETNLDDMNPEFFEPLIDTLFHKGALDVTLTPVHMKKQRPGQILSVMAKPAIKEDLAQVVLNHSSAIGVRFFECERRMLQRKPLEVPTKWGAVQGKLCWGQHIEPRFTPEYESCRQLHQKTGQPLARIYQAAIQAYFEQQTHNRGSE